jgi:hypothetical protein
MCHGAGGNFADAGHILLRGQRLCEHLIRYFVRRFWKKAIWLRTAIIV